MLPSRTASFGNASMGNARPADSRPASASSTSFTEDEEISIPNSAVLSLENIQIQIQLQPGFPFRYAG